VFAFFRFDTGGFSPGFEKVMSIAVQCRFLRGRSNIQSSKCAACVSVLRCTVACSWAEWVFEQACLALADSSETNSDPN